MEIKRKVNGVDVVFQLTQEELYQVLFEVDKSDLIEWLDNHDEYNAQKILGNRELTETIVSIFQLYQAGEYQQHMEDAVEDALSTEDNNTSYYNQDYEAM